ncbi:G elongation factor, mitochondrial 2 [Perkinsus olseni]|uniref:G elongation factor, mitochondrial 2 n=1 Tax=Perkinsus olseni TaxID=32597 RepID=A0A7J6RZD7_PEROL|nr:G elongation factor, mitochondrial 2 [Perkinsus olseni]KAF4726047.1 G elongation factor, mitochondrial 2 [Perkinsus olseni]
MSSFRPHGPFGPLVPAVTSSEWLKRKPLGYKDAAEKDSSEKDAELCAEESELPEWAKVSKEEYFRYENMFCGYCGSFYDQRQKGQYSVCSRCGAKRDRFATGPLMESHAVLDYGEMKVWMKNIIDEEEGKEKKGDKKMALVDEECPKCKNPRMAFWTQQLRSADEGQTVFYECQKCGYRFNVNTSGRRGFSGAAAVVERLRMIRNIGVFAHVDAGKTSTTERMLLHAGEIGQPGSVDRGTAQMDYLRQEVERGISIRAAATTFKWADYTINLVDTPGHVEFGAEVQRAVRVLDGAVVVIDGTAGVQAQTRTIWKQTDHLPRVIFVNKLDIEGASWETAVGSLSTALPQSISQPVMIQYPLLRLGGGIRGTVDLLTRQGYEYRGEYGEVMSEISVEDKDDLDGVEKARAELLETLAILDEKFAEEYFGRGEMSAASTSSAIRRQSVSRALVPVLFGSAVSNIGIQHLMNSIALYLSNPMEAARDRHHYLPDPLAEGTVIEAFKVIPPSTDPEEEERGNVVYCRILSGNVAAGTRLRNRTREREGEYETASGVYRVKASELHPRKVLLAGDIGVVTGLQNIRSGDILTGVDGEGSMSGACEAIIALRKEDAKASELPGVCFTTFTSNTRDNDERLRIALQRMMLEDPSLDFKVDANTGQFLVWGMGDFHLDLLRDRIETEYQIPAKMGDLRITYREYLSEAFALTSSSPGHDLDLSMRFMMSVGPTRDLPVLEEGEEAGEGAYVNEVDIVDGVDAETTLPEELKAELRELLCDALTMGPLKKSRMAATHVTLSDVVWKAGHDSSGDTAVLKDEVIRMYHCLMRMAKKKGSIMVLEPIVQVTISGPESIRGTLSGAVRSELIRNRRAHVDPVESHDDFTCELVAYVPQSKMKGYAAHVRAATGGRTTLQAVPIGYTEIDLDTLNDELYDDF